MIDTSPASVARSHPASVPVVAFETPQLPAPPQAITAKIALAHHWALVRRGGEKVLEQIASLFPGADLHMLVCDRESLVPDLRGRRICTSLLQHVASLRPLYKHFLPLHPTLIRGIKVCSSTELMITSDAALMKSIRVPDGAKHICYCHSPPRYLWEMEEEYGKNSLLTRIGLTIFGNHLRRVDQRAAAHVDVFVANSHFVAQRIRRVYQRDAAVIHPPVDVDRFNPHRQRDSFYLVVAALVPYKRVDLAVAACTRLNLPLVVVGDGPEKRRLTRMAGPTVEFRGRCSDEEVTSLMERAKAFLMPGIEDFGITPVEAQAAGCPVITIAHGGATETVLDGETGVYFSDQNIASISQAIERTENETLSAWRCRENAEKFRQEIFRQKLMGIVQQTLQDSSTSNLTPQAA